MSKEYLARMAEIGITLEIELGVTGGEEDGVDNSEELMVPNYIPSQEEVSFEPMRIVAHQQQVYHCSYFW